MNILLDTHTFIWFFNGDEQLSFKARKLIEDSKTKKFVSIASIWEVAIKIGLKKLVFDGNTSEISRRNNLMSYSLCLIFSGCIH